MAPEFAFVSCYLSIAVYLAVNSLIIIRSAKKRAFVNALEMTISSWVDPEYQFRQAFSHSIGGQYGSVT